MSKEIETTVSGILQSLGVKVIISQAGVGLIREGWECDGWHVQMQRDNIFEFFDYYTGIGHRKSKNPIPSEIARLGKNILARKEWEERNVLPVAPHVAGVLYSLVLDSEAGGQSFNNWCSDFGYDSDSIKAFETYQACCKEAKQLAKLFKRAELETLKEALQDY